MEQVHKWKKEIIAWLNGKKVEWSNVEEEIKIFDLNIDERNEIIEKVWSEMKDALCLDHRTFGHQLIEEVFKKRGEK